MQQNFREGGTKLLSSSFSDQVTVSIIIATLNVSETLQRCLDSVYSQVFQKIDIVIMDGLSTDGTVNILENNSHRIYYWKSEVDSGIYYGLNKALQFIRGSWVIFIGADDVLLPGFSDMAQELSEPNSIYYGSVLYKESKCAGYMNPYQMAKLGMQHQAMFYSASVFKKHQYNTEYRISADSILNMECWSDKSIKFIFKDYIITRFNHTGISAREPDELLKKNMSRLILKHFGTRIWLRYLLRMFKKKFKTA
jgi:hypothetical protein